MTAQPTSISLGVALLLATLFTAACGPVPGGKLGGVATTTPADWDTYVEDGHTICEIESRPSDPHSIQLDCFLYEDGLYVQSHRWALSSWWPVESWVAIWIQEPPVRVRIGRQLFDTQALHISAPTERKAILSYRGYDPVPDGIEVFQFIPR
jgi:hypothetical protein